MVPTSIRIRAAFFLALLGMSVHAQESWRRVYGGFDNDLCTALRVAAPDRFVAVGSTGSFGNGSSDIYLFEVNESGVRNWSRTIGGLGIEQAQDMRVASNGDLIIAGFIFEGPETGYDGLLIRTDPAGEVLWQRTYGGADWDFINQVKVLDDGGLLLVGQTFSAGEAGGNAWLLRTDAMGDVIWERTLGGSGEHDGRSAAPTADGGLVMVGSFRSVAGDLDGFLARYDASGELQWWLALGGDSLDIARDVVHTTDGGYSIVGTTRSFSPFHESWHVRLDAVGNVLWERNWGQVNDQESQEHVQLDNAEYMVIGYTKTTGGGGKDMIMMKIGTDGGYIYGRTFGGSDDEEGFGLAVVDDGYLCGGYTRSYGAGGADVFLVRTLIDGTTATETVITSFDPLSVEDRITTSATWSVFPNPSEGAINWQSGMAVTAVRLYDHGGRLLETHASVAGTTSIRTAVASGAYIAEAVLRDGTLLRSRILIVRP